MNERTMTVLALGVCAMPLIVGFVVSVRLEAGISHAAHLEATRQSPVPTPPSLGPVKAAPAHA